MTIRSLIAQVRNNLNVTSDDYISGEFIFWTAINIAQLFLKRDADNRKVFKNTTLFKKLECVELEPYEEGCVELNCNSIMRSKIQLPSFYQSNFGSLIKVYNVSRDVDYVEISVNKYKNVKNLEFKPRRTKYYWIEDNYLILPDSTVEKVIVYGLFTDPSVGLTGDCSLLDQEFPCVPYLIGSVVEATIKQIYTAKGIPRDEDTNANSNTK